MPKLQAQGNHKRGTISLPEQKMQQIWCLVFVGSGQDDDLGGGGQSKEAARLLGNKAFYAPDHLFITDTGAGEHYAIGAEGRLSRVTLDWLAGYLTVRRIRIIAPPRAGLAGTVLDRWDPCCVMRLAGVRITISAPGLWFSRLA
jgi:hypothetical protein